MGAPVWGLSVSFCSRSRWTPSTTLRFFDSIPVQRRRHGPESPRPRPERPRLGSLRRRGHAAPERRNGVAAAARRGLLRGVGRSGCTPQAIGGTTGSPPAGCARHAASRPPARAPLTARFLFDSSRSRLIHAAPAPSHASLEGIHVLGEALGSLRSGSGSRSAMRDATVRQAVGSRASSFVTFPFNGGRPSRRSPSGRCVCGSFALTRHCGDRRGRGARHDLERCDRHDHGTYQRIATRLVMIALSPPIAKFFMFL